MNKPIRIQVEELLTEQCQNWPLAKKNFDGLAKVITRACRFANGTTLRIQFNPERMVSSSAKTDAQSIAARNCFLCDENRPTEQRSVPFEKHYRILINPFPIFKKHLTITGISHTDQRIEGRIQDMLQLAEALDEYVVFYNGPACGASAPDHFHFQAGNKGFMPVESDFENLPLNPITQNGNFSIHSMDDGLRKAIVLSSKEVESIAIQFEKIYNSLASMQPSQPEPMINLLAWKKEGDFVLVIFPRKAHRPAQYFMDGGDQILFSPAAVDLGGVLITPREQDFYKMDEALISNLFRQIVPDAEAWASLIQNITV